MRVLNYTLLLLPVLSGTAQAQLYKYSNEFLSIGVGARAFGMSGAAVASVSDVTAGYWNPAALASIQNDLQLGLMHSEYFAGIAKYDYGALAKVITPGKRSIGFSLVRFAVDDIPNTLFLLEQDGSVNYNNITSFSVADYGFLFSYAQTVKNDAFRAGGNFKVVHRKAGSFATGWGFGLDAGAQYDLSRHWKLGMMARDITTTFNAWSFSFTEEEKLVFAQTENVIPENSVEITLPKFILGTACHYDLSEKISFLAEADLDVTTDGKRNVLISGEPVSIDPHLGFEFGYAQIAFFRGGVGNLQRSTDDLGSRITTVQPNIGAGLKIRNIKIDYALTDVGNQSQALYSHVFSLIVEINKPEHKPM